MWCKPHTSHVQHEQWSRCVTGLDIIENHWRIQGARGAMPPPQKKTSDAGLLACAVLHKRSAVGDVNACLCSQKCGTITYIVTMQTHFQS